MDKLAAERLGKAAGKIDLFPVCKEDWRGRISIEQAGEDQEKGREGDKRQAVRL